MTWSIPIIETKRLMLRDIRISDAQSIYSYGKQEKVAQYVLFNRHESIDDTKRFIDSVLKRYEKGEHYVWAIDWRETGKMIGTCGLHDTQTPHRSAEMGYVINPDFWNKGIATEAGRVLLDFGFNTLKLHRICARYFEGNEASKRVMEKLGMIREGIERESVCKDGVFCNILVYSIIESESKTPLDKI